jgi:hypothetical protein
MEAMLEALLASITYVNGFAKILFSFFCTLFGKRGFFLNCGNLHMGFSHH